MRASNNVRDLGVCEVCGLLVLASDDYAKIGQRVWHKRCEPADLYARWLQGEFRQEDKAQANGNSDLFLVREAMSPFFRIAESSSAASDVDEQTEQEPPDHE